MSDFVNALTTGPKSQHKATADFATGAVVLAIFAVLVVAQVMFATLNPKTVATAAELAPFGIVAP
jgi:hypothetical protein